MRALVAAAALGAVLVALSGSIGATEAGKARKCQGKACTKAALNACVGVFSAPGRKCLAHVARRRLDGERVAVAAVVRKPVAPERPVLASRTDTAPIATAIPPPRMSYAPRTSQPDMYPRRAYRSRVPTAALYRY